MSQVSDLVTKGQRLGIAPETLRELAVEAETVEDLMRLIEGEAQLLETPLARQLRAGVIYPDEPW